MTTKQRTGLRLVKDMLYARRNKNIAREQAAYDKLWAFAVKNNFDYTTLVDDCTRYLKAHDVAAIMNGLV